LNLLFKQICDSVDDNPGFSGPGTGENKNRALVCTHRFILFVIQEMFEIDFHHLLVLMYLFYEQLVKESEKLFSSKNYCCYDNSGNNHPECYCKEGF